jgi:hypothetical protein
MCPYDSYNLIIYDHKEYIYTKYQCGLFIYKYTLKNN